jgi:hypothetical protein
MFVDRPGAYPRVELLKGPSLRWAGATLTNIRMGWKGLPGTNTLAYYEHSEIAGMKGFITLGPGQKGFPWT